MRIDLHAHSTASDGTVSPADLVRLAAGVPAALDVVALTDHDTTAGWAAAIAALPTGLTLVPGAELSCRYVPPGGEPVSLHLLAYLFDPDEPALAAELATVRDGRRSRARDMVEALRDDGYPISWDAVRARAGGGTVGRPHVAAELVAGGVVASADLAFGPDWLATRGRYWRPKPELDVLAALRLVRAAGGVPVFAHPRAARRGPTVDDAAIAAMARAGLFGIEVDHLDHTAAERTQLRGLAASLGLAVTGSSDFHGTARDVGLGAWTTAPEVYGRLLEQAGRTPVTG